MFARHWILFVCGMNHCMGTSASGGVLYSVENRSKLQNVHASFPSSFVRVVESGGAYFLKPLSPT